MFGGDYSYLAPYTASGAAVNVTVSGNLEMPASSIAALGGGNVTVTSTGGSMDLGSQDLIDEEEQVTRAHNIALGIYNTGAGNVNVTALGDINIDSSRIAAFNGGNVNIMSFQGNINAGSGGASVIPVLSFYVNAGTGQAGFYGEQVYASGIAAETLADSSHPGDASLPGNITVSTPRGDIIANQGGILQEALNGNTAAGPVINLTAGTTVGTFGQSDYQVIYVGNIDLGNSGAIGGSINATASGNINGLIISRQNSNVNAAQNFSGTVLAGGTANLSVGGNVSGTVVGIGGVTASGGGTVTASLLGTSVNGGGSTLGTTATATATSQAAASQASSDAKQQVASNNSGSDDDDKKKKKGLPLLHRIKRVTVILPKAT